MTDNHELIFDPELPASPEEDMIAAALIGRLHARIERLEARVRRLTFERDTERSSCHMLRDLLDKEREQRPKSD
jgi:hypothetical protein